MVQQGIQNIDKAYMLGDNAGTYKQTKSQASSQIPHEVTEADLVQIEKNGYVVIEDVLSKQEIENIKQQIHPLLKNAGRNEFEGYKTQRLYAVLTKTRVLDRLVDHPRILAIHSFSQSNSFHIISPQCHD